MKRLLIVAAASLLIFGGQAEASTVESFDRQIETQEMGKWAHFRDKYLLGRETENERRNRKEWERRQRERERERARQRERERERARQRDRYRDDNRYFPPSAPPNSRNGRRYNPPPPPKPPYYKDGKRYYPPNPPPTRYR